MIRNEVYRNGVVIEADCYDLDARLYHREEMGNVIESRSLTTEEWLAYGPQPLDSIGALTTLLVVEGVLPIIDAANAIGVTPNDLTLEAQAWAAAAMSSDQLAAVFP